MRNFFVKIGKAGVPTEIVNPRTGADWEQGHFVTPKAMCLNANPRGKPKFIPVEAPQTGDRVYIWVDQNDEGLGLTAVGIIRDIKSFDENITFTLKDINLFEKPYVTFGGGPESLRYFARGPQQVEAYGFLKDAHHNRRNRTQELSGDDIDDLISVLEKLGDSSLTVR